VRVTGKGTTSAVRTRGRHLPGARDFENDPGGYCILPDEVLGWDAAFVQWPQLAVVGYVVAVAGLVCE